MKKVQTPMIRWTVANRDRRLEEGRVRVTRVRDAAGFAVQLAEKHGARGVFADPRADGYAVSDPALNGLYVRVYVEH